MFELSILVTLTPSESKRMIAKAVAALPVVKKAFREGKILIGNGTTTGYVAEELLGIKMEKWKFPSGVITQGRTCSSPDDRLHPILINKGTVMEPNLDLTMWEELPGFVCDFDCEDVLIKGANAVDAAGNVGFLLSHPEAGTIGMALGRIAAQGSRLIVPVGLEKMVSSVIEASRTVPGIRKFQYSFGLGAGYLAVTNAIVITEIQAFFILTGAKATHLASGGVGGSEGAVTLFVEGDEQQTRAAVELIAGVKGEEPLKSWKRMCQKCNFRCQLFPEKKQTDKK